MVLWFYEIFCSSAKSNRYLLYVWHEQWVDMEKKKMFFLTNHYGYIYIIKPTCIATKQRLSFRVLDISQDNYTNKLIYFYDV